MNTARSLLVVVHNVTAATRLFDVVDGFAGDPRIEASFTVPGSSAFTAGTGEYLRSLGIEPVDWDSAVAKRFDVVLAASLGGNLTALPGPRVIIPHGMGYNKYLSGKAGKRESGKAGKRESGKAGKRESGKAGKRESGKAGKRESAFGLRPLQ